jgi:Uncharacterized conserved small protein
MSPSPRKLRLGPLPDTHTVKLTFSCPARLKADLDRYAALARTDLWRDGRCGDPDPAHARGVHVPGSGVQKGRQGQGPRPETGLMMRLPFAGPPWSARS